jgi:hypothetical protein
MSNESFKERPVGFTRCVSPKHEGRAERNSGYLRAAYAFPFGSHALKLMQSPQDCSAMNDRIRALCPGSQPEFFCISEYISEHRLTIAVI